MKPIYQTIAKKFENLSNGDRSCLVEMFERPSAEQLTSINSPNDQFYIALEELRWARRAVLDEGLKKFGTFVAWTLTPLGKEKLPGFLIAVDILKYKNSYESQLFSNFSVLSLKFFAGYALVQISTGIAIYGLTRVDVNIAPIQGLLSIGLILASCLVGILVATTPWRRRSDKPDLVKRAGTFEAISSKFRILCLYFVPPVFLFHLAVEKMRPLMAPESIADLVGNPVTRAVVMAAIVAAGCWIILPTVVNAKLEKAFKN